MIKKLLPGLIPLLVFILADEFWGLKIGLAVAVSFGIAEMIFSFYKEKKLDRFVLLDTVLLLIFSALSFLFDNEIFFRVKPAMINLVLLALIALSLFTRFDPLGNLSRRYLRNDDLNEHQKASFKKNLKVLFGIVLFHTGLVLWTAFYSSKEIWGFVSSFLLFILLGIYVILTLIWQKWFTKNKPLYSDAEEWLPIVDEDGRILGKALRSYCHNGSKTLHPVIHLHVIGENHTLFLQKRANTKLIQPGMWDTAVGGHVGFGENLEDTLRREAAEEIGLLSFEPTPILRYRWDSNIESELVYSFITKGSIPNVTVSDEISEGKYWRINDIENHIGKGVFTPNFEYEFNLLKTKENFR